MQTWPQPLLQHLWPQGHSSSKLQRSRHVPPSLGMGHTPTLPARQTPGWGAPGCGHPPGQPRTAPGGLAAPHLRGCPCRRGCSPCWCTSVPRDTASHPCTPPRTGHCPCPGSLQGHGDPLSPTHPRGSVGHTPPDRLLWYLRARPRTASRSRCRSTSPLAGRRCRPGTGFRAGGGGPSTALPGDTPRGALWEQGTRARLWGPGPAHTPLPVPAAGLPVLTSGRAGAAHGTAGEAAFLLPGTVPVMGAGVLLRAGLRCLPRPHLRALARFV